VLRRTDGGSPARCIPLLLDPIRCQQRRSEHCARLRMWWADDLTFATAGSWRQGLIDKNIGVLPPARRQPSASRRCSGRPEQGCGEWCTPFDGERGTMVAYSTVSCQDTKHRGVALCPGDPQKNPAPVGADANTQALSQRKISPRQPAPSRQPGRPFPELR